MISLVAGLLLAVSVQQPESDLHARITAADTAMFAAFNSCDGEEFGRYISEEVEFYHDLDGLLTDKASLVEAVNTSICNNFQRILAEDSIEVWPVPGYGAVQTGLHFFINYGAETPHGQGRFLHIWQEGEAGWQITRVVSYDHAPFAGAEGQTPAE